MYTGWGINYKTLNFKDLYPSLDLYKEKNYFINIFEYSNAYSRAAWAIYTVHIMVCVPSLFTVIVSDVA